MSKGVFVALYAAAAFLIPGLIGFAKGEPRVG